MSHFITRYTNLRNTDLRILYQVCHDVRRFVNKSSTVRWATVWPQ